MPSAASRPCMHAGWTYLCRLRFRRWPAPGSTGSQLRHSPGPPTDRQPVRSFVPPGVAVDRTSRARGAVTVPGSGRGAARVRMEEGVAQRLAEPYGSVDLIWCRDMLGHIEDLAAVFGEFGRVLRPGGAAVIYQMTATDQLTPAEAARLWPPIGAYACSVDPQRFEAAIAAGGLRIGQCVQLGGEWRERDEEDGGGRTCRQLLHVSRLLRNRPAYQERFGEAAYEAMLGNCLWGVYQMIGKLNPRVYVLRR